MKRIDAYKEILNTIKDCKSKVDGVLNNDINIEHNLENLIVLEELQEKFKINLQNTYNYPPSHIRLKDDLYLTYFGKHNNAKISFPDDGKQPDDVWLLHIHYSTGAYMFGNDYPCKVFNAFFQELKTFKPSHIDSANHALYFTEDTAKDFYDNYKDIEKKYYEIAKQSRKQSQIEKLKEELKELEGN